MRKPFPPFRPQLDFLPLPNNVTDVQPTPTLQLVQLRTVEHQGRPMRCFFKKKAGKLL